MARAAICDVGPMTATMSRQTNSKQCNSRAGAVKVATNLQEELSVHVHFTKLRYCQKRQVFEVILHVELTLTVSEILKFQFFP